MYAFRDLIEFFEQFWKGKITHYAILLSLNCCKEMRAVPCLFSDYDCDFRKRGLLQIQTFINFEFSNSET